MILSSDFLTNIAILWGDSMPSIVLYHNSAENERVNKTPYLTNESAYSGDFRDSIDLHNPVFTINDTVSASYNYCKITVGTETRYYFARVENIRTGLSMIHCALDVLMTFDISNVPVVPARSESSYNDYIIDAMQPAETRVQHYNLLFSGDNLDYSNMTMIAGIVGTGGTPTDF